MLALTLIALLMLVYCTVSVLIAQYKLDNRKLHYKRAFAEPSFTLSREAQERALETRLGLTRDR